MFAFKKEKEQGQNIVVLLIFLFLFLHLIQNDVLARRKKIETAEVHLWRALRLAQGAHLSCPSCASSKGLCLTLGEEYSRQSNVESPCT